MSETDKWLIDYGETHGDVDNAGSGDDDDGDNAGRNGNRGSNNK